MYIMVRRLLVLLMLVMILGVGSGCSTIIHSITGNTAAMKDYLAETNVITDSYNDLLNRGQEYYMQPDTTEEDIIIFTEKVIVPTLENIITNAKNYGEQIKNDELKEVHELYIRAFEIELNAEKNWLENQDETAYNEMLLEAQELDQDYDSQIESLANQWGVTIELENE